MSDEDRSEEDKAFFADAETKRLKHNASENARKAKKRQEVDRVKNMSDEDRSEEDKAFLAGAEEKRLAKNQKDNERVEKKRQERMKTDEEYAKKIQRLNEMPVKECSICLKSKKEHSFHHEEWDKEGDRQCQVCTKAAQKEADEDGVQKLDEMPTKQCSLCLKNKKKWSFTVGEWDKVGERQCQVCTKTAAKETSAASSVGNASMTTSNTQSSAPVSSSTKWSSMSLSKDINENPLQLYQTQLTIHGSTLVAVNLQRCCEFISLPINEVQRYEIFYQVARYPNQMVPIQMIYLRPGTFLLPQCSDEQTIQGYVYVISTHHIGNINDNFDV